MDQPGPKSGDGLGTPCSVTLVLEGFVPKGMEVLEQHPDWLNAGEAVRGSDPAFFSWRVWAGCKHLPAPSFPVLGALRALGNAARKAERGQSPFSALPAMPLRCLQSPAGPVALTRLGQLAQQPNGETEAGRGGASTRT